MILNFKPKPLSKHFLLAYPFFHKPLANFSTALHKQKNYITRLDSRSLLIMHGPQTYKLLQGLTTNDINLLSKKSLQSKKQSGQPLKKPENDKVSLYTLFLNPKGKIITDAFIYKPKIFLNGQRKFAEDQLWIDVHSSTKKDLFHHLKKYMWKKQVELVDVDAEPDNHKPSIYVGYNHISTFSGYLDQGMELPLNDQEPQEEEYSNLMMFDPRGGSYGRRILCMQEEMGLPLTDFQQMPESTYEDFERSAGFTATHLTRNKLPFQFNYDFLNAVSFKKGCYLGQEMVSRSYFTGIVRRRVFPFIVDDQFVLTDAIVNEMKEGCSLINPINEEMGKIIFYEKGKIGLALAPYLNYFPQVEKKQQQNTISSGDSNMPRLLALNISAPFSGTLYCPFNDALLKYIDETRSKQKTLEQLDI